MSNDQLGKSIGAQINEATAGTLAPFARFRAIHLAKEEGLTPTQGAAVARAIHQAFMDGKEQGTREALYDAKPDRWTFGEFIHMHKVGELRILEYIPNFGDEHKGKVRFSAKLSNHAYGDMYKDFDAALLEAIAAKHDGMETTAGHYMVRMLGMEKG